MLRRLFLSSRLINDIQIFLGQWWKSVEYSITRILSPTRHRGNKRERVGTKTQLCFTRVQKDFTEPGWTNTALLTQLHTRHTRPQTQHELLLMHHTCVSMCYSTLCNMNTVGPHIDADMRSSAHWNTTGRYTRTDMNQDATQSRWRDALQETRVSLKAV